MNARLASGLGWLLLTLVLVLLGWVLIATSFMVYDDEGYVLMSVRNFCDGHRLYTDVFSQYGPAFYLYYQFLHVLTGLTYDHTTGRLITLAYWVASALVLGSLAARLTFSRIAGWSAAVLGFVTLAPNINEPFHPGSLLALVSILAAWAGVEGIRQGSILLGLTVGALGAFALLIKINVGLFILCPWGAWWLLNLSPDSRWRNGTVWAVAAAVIAMPLALMRAHLGEGWAIGFAWMFTTGALGFWLQLSRACDAPPSRKAWLWPAVIASGIIVVTAGMAISGTSLPALWHGAVVAPLSHPNVYTYPAGTTLMTGALALLSFAALVWILKQPDGRRRTLIISGMRIAGLVLYFWQTKVPVNHGGLVLFSFEWSPLLAGWMLAPLSASSTRETLARIWLGWFFCWQILQAYPVAGSQAAWGSALWPPIAVIGCIDLCRHFALRWPRSRILGLAAVSGAALVALSITGLCARAWWHDSLPLGLQGAHWMRPTPEITRSIQILDTNIRRESGLVFSLPGMFSFNLWSGHPSPSTANTTHWFSLLNDRQQSEIIHALAADPRATLVVQRDLLRFLLEKGYKPSGLLTDYLRVAFVPAIRVGSYDLCVKRGRTIKAVNTFRVEGDRLVAWVEQPASPCPLSVSNPLFAYLPEIVLPDAVWTAEGGLWKIDAPLPANWRALPGTLLLAAAPGGVLSWPENTLVAR